MIKKRSRLQIHDIAEAKARLAPRELSGVKLKQVSAGLLESDSSGGTCTACDDTDC